MQVPRHTPDPVAPSSTEDASYGSALRLGAEVSSRLLGLGAQVIIARTLGLAGYGEYAALGAVATVAAAGADLGLLGLASRDVVTGGVRLDDLSRTRLRPSLAVLALALAVAPTSTTLALLLLAMLLTGWVEFLGAGLRSLGRRDLEATLLVLQRGALLVAVAWLAPHGPTPAGVAAVHAAAAVPVALLAAWMARRVEPPARGGATGVPRDLLRRAAPLALHSAFFLLGMRVELVVLQAIAGDAAAGAYAAALRVVETLGAVPNAVSAGAMPALTREAAGSGSGVRRRTLATAMVLAVPAAAAIALEASRVASAVFGPGFHDAVPPLRVLAAALLPLFTGNVLLHLLVASGRYHRLPWLSGGRVVVGATAAFALATPWGPVGAAAAYLLSELALAVAAAAICRREGLQLA